MKKTAVKAGLLAVMLVMVQSKLALAQDWPMFHHDLAHTGYTASNAPDTNNILWKFQTGAFVWSSPAVVGSKVYVGSNNGILYCLDKLTGTVIWSYPTDGSIQSSPAVSDGKVYFLSSNGIFYALDAENGDDIWSAVIGPGRWDWSSPAVHDGNVFVVTSLGSMFSFNADNGIVNWSTPIGGEPDSPITVVNGLVYSGTHNFDSTSSTLVAVDEVTGTIIWTYDYFAFHSGVDGMVNCNGPAVVDSDGDGKWEVYFGVYNWNGVDDQAVCLDEATGNELWTQNINGNSTSTPAVHDGKMFIGSDDSKLYALDTADGSVIWSFQTGAPIWGAPAVSGDGKVCFGSLDHTVYCVDENTGDLIWSYFTGASRLMSSPAISDGILFIGNENGNIYAFGSPPSSPPRIEVRGEGYVSAMRLHESNSDDDVPVASCEVSIEGFDYVDDSGDIHDTNWGFIATASGTQLNLALLKAQNMNERIGLIATYDLSCGKCDLKIEAFECLGNWHSGGK